MAKARTKRSDALEDARNLVVVVMDAILARKPDTTSPPLSVIVDHLAEAFPDRAAATEGSRRQQRVAAFEQKWMKLIRRDKHERQLDAALLSEHPRSGGHVPRFSDDSAVVRAVLVDALDVIGVHRPESFTWVKGLPKNGSPDDRISHLTDFVIERCIWDERLTVTKAEMYAAYATWFREAQKMNPTKYSGEPFTMKAFALQLNHIDETRPNQKGEERGSRSWKGIGLASPGTEPAGSRAARETERFLKALRLALAETPRNQLN